MELENLFTDLKWRMIKMIADKPRSPTEIASALNTSLSNISQQIRLLEFMGIVVKQREKTKKVGKPRTVYSIVKDYAYLITVMPGFSEKKLIELDDKQIRTLKI